MTAFFQSLSAISYDEIEECLNHDDDAKFGVNVLSSQVSLLT